MRIDNIEWNEKKHHGFGRPTKNSDVFISIHTLKHGKKKQNKLWVSFRNEALKFAGKSKRMGVSKIISDRIYFLPDKDDGYAVLNPHKTSDQKVVSFVIDEATVRKMMNVWEGDYPIKFDTECGLYFVEKGDKK